VSHNSRTEVQLPDYQTLRYLCDPERGHSLSSQFLCAHLFPMAGLQYGFFCFFLHTTEDSFAAVLDFLTLLQFLTKIDLSQSQV
jgi:hypothetical protein